MKKKILFITAFPPNRKTGGQNYSRQLLNEISQDNIVDVVTFSYQDHKLELNTNDNLIVKKIIKINYFTKILNVLILFWIFPFFSVRFNLSLLQFLRRNKDNYDILYFDFSQVFIYSFFVKHSCKVLMCHDVIDQKYKRKNVLNFIQKWITFSEKILLKSGTHLYCFSSKDKSIINEVYKLQANVVTFYLDPLATNLDLFRIEIQDYFVFFGAWNRAENIEGLIWFLDNVYIHLKKKICIKILGGGLDIKQQEYLKQFSNIEYIGFIENPFIIIAKSQALIAPLFQGAGVKVKVVDTLTIGTAIIGTAIAFEGLDLDVFERNNIKTVYWGSNAQSFIDIIDHWENVTYLNKSASKECFLNSYSKSRFSDYLL